MRFKLFLNQAGRSRAIISSPYAHNARIHFMAIHHRAEKWRKTNERPRSCGRACDHVEESSLRSAGNTRKAEKAREMSAIRNSHARTFHFTRTKKDTKLGGYVCRL